MKAYRVFFNSNPYDESTDSYWLKELDANKRCNDLNEQRNPFNTPTTLQESDWDVEEINIK